MLTNLFLKALRYDSKYQVLHDYPHFEELYAIHKGFMPKVHDSHHEQRMKLFQHVVHHVQYWLNEHAVQQHAHDLRQNRRSGHPRVIATTACSHPEKGAAPRQQLGKATSPCF